MIKEFQKEYRWLSNFAPCIIVLNGRAYSSVEHAYMSCKSDDPQWKDICACDDNTPGQIKRMSKDIDLTPDWDEKKLLHMANCIVQKYAQEPYKSKLKATGDKHIQEGNYWNDKYWGVCLKTNKGQNQLGKLIMHVRDNIK